MKPLLKLCQPDLPATIEVQNLAPAKLILSGEHAVVYGQSAISLPIDLHSSCQLKFEPAERTQFHIALETYASEHSFTELQSHQSIENIQERYQKFLDHKLSINEVLQSPFDLILIALAEFSQFASLPAGEWHLKFSSEIPMERGLGSSASLIIAILKTLNQLTRANLTDEQFLRLAQSIENYQHGRSSGLDPATIYLNQTISFRKGEWQTLDLGPLPPSLKAWLIDSGKSRSSTGETVTKVSEAFTEHSEIWQAFNQTRQKIENSWNNNNIMKLLSAINDNQTLLVKIGVVPMAVQNWIKQLLATQGGAAKVCGAGSIRGESAGMVLYIGKESPQTFCNSHQLKCYPIKL